jgi:arylsulfatase A-like enzyme
VRLRNVVPPQSGGRKPGLAGVATTRIDYSHDLLAREALQFVESHRNDTFFLYLAFTIPHANNEAGNKGMEVPDFGPYAGRDWPDPEKGRAAMITRMDADVGRLFAKLKELGLDEKTIAFFSSDNGPHKEGGSDPEYFHSSGPLRGFKRSLHDGGIRVPMIVRWPGHVKGGTVSHFPWAFWDFLPTAAELAGVAPPPGLDGISVVPTLLGRGTQKEHEFFYWEFHEGGSQQAVRMGPWKAVRRWAGPVQLYDLRTDLGESTDVAAAHPDVAARIEGYLETARTESSHWPMSAGKAKTGAKRKPAKGVGLSAADQAAGDHGESRTR